MIEGMFSELRASVRRDSSRDWSVSRVLNASDIRDSVSREFSASASRESRVVCLFGEYNFLERSVGKLWSRVFDSRGLKSSKY